MVGRDPALPLAASRLLVDAVLLVAPPVPLAVTVLLVLDLGRRRGLVVRRVARLVLRLGRGFGRRARAPVLAMRNGRDVVAVVAAFGVVGVVVGRGRHRRPVVLLAGSR